MAQERGIYLFLYTFVSRQQGSVMVRRKRSSNVTRYLSKCVLRTSVENERDRGNMGIEKKDGLLPGGIGIALNKTSLVITCSEVSTGSK